MSFDSLASSFFLCVCVCVSITVVVRAFYAYGSMNCSKTHLSKAIEMTLNFRIHEYTNK